MVGVGTGGGEMPNPKAVHPRANCPECGNEFSVMYMPVHRTKRHGVKEAWKAAFKPHTPSPKGRIPCPECGRTFAISYLQQHRRTTHGVYGGTSGIERRQVARPVAVATAESSEVVEVPLKFGNGKTIYTETEFKVLVDSNGNLWLAEPIGR